MANINLLPWRDEERHDLTIQFLIVLGICAFLVGLSVSSGHIIITKQIDHQKARNAFLQDEITRLDKQLKQIGELENTKSKLLARMNIIQSLQQRRPQIVHLFDEFVRTVPEGIYLESIVQKGKSLTIKGIAESNGRVSAYMRNIDASEWMTTPRLKIIKTKKGSFRRNEFTLITGQASPKSTIKGNK